MRVAKILNTSKVVDEGGFKGNFSSMVFGPLAFYIVDIFNHVVCFGFLPWLQNIIYPIFKSGNTLYLNNYKTVMSWAHFCQALHYDRGHVAFNTFGEAQTVYQRASGLQERLLDHDHIFTVCDIIEEAKQWSSKLFCCFMDFQKAFDFIVRDSLTQRLCNIDIFDSLAIVFLRLYDIVIDKFSSRPF